MKEVNFGMPKPGGPGQLSPVKLTERPGFGAPPDPNVPPPPFPVPMAEFKPQLYLKDGVLQPLGIDGVIGGSISAQAAENLTLECDIPTVNGVYADGGSVYQIRNAQIHMTGDCINDFGGNGAGLQVMGRAQVSMENSSIDTSGALRSCIMADEYASLAVKNCTLICRGGEPAPDHPGRMVPGGPGMLQAPPSMEVDGHSRLCLIAGNAHARFQDCKIVSDAWAALSTDASWGDTYLEADHCEITVERPGYGVFSDEGSLVALNGCRVRTASHCGMVCGNAKLRFRRCTLDSDRYGIYAFAIMARNGAQVADITLDCCAVHAKEAPLLIRGANAYLDVRGTQLSSDSGILLKTEVFQDPMASKAGEGEPVYGVKAVFSDMQMQGDILHEDPDRAMALSFLHCTYRGAIRNATIRLDQISTWFATGDSDITLDGAFEPAQIDAAEGITIHAAWAAKPDHCEIPLPSGGNLILN